MKYEVGVDYVIAGGVAKFDDIASAAGRVGYALESSVRSAALLAAGLAGLAAGFAASQVVDGVIGLNANLENAKLTLGSLFQGDMGISFAASMEVASDQIAKMRVDASALPGTFNDLLQIMQTIATPGAQLGLSPDQLRQKSAQIMVASKIAGVDKDQAARESAQLMEGRAGMHNVFGMRIGLMGDEATKFNALSPEKRLKELTSRLDKKVSPEAMAAQGQSFEGVSSSAMDAVNKFKQEATKPLFDKVKKELDGISNWFAKNQSTVSYWSYSIGEKLTWAFDKGKAAILDWWPPLMQFAQDARREILGVWDKIEPIVTRIAAALKESLGNGQMLAHIETILKLYAAVQVMKVASSVGSGVGSLVSGGMELMSGGGAAAGGAVAAEGAAAALAAWPAIVALGVAAALTAGQLSAMADTSSKHHEAALNNASELATEFARLTTTVSQGNGTLTAMFQYLGTKVTGALASVVGVTADVLGHENTKAEDLFESNLRIDQALERRDRENRTVSYELPIKSIASDAVPYNPNYKKEPDKAKDKAPSHPGTTVQKVEIVVTSNQDPERVARSVLTHIQNLSRHPKIAKGQPNYAKG